MSQDLRVLRRRLVVAALIISLINCNHHTASAILVNRTIDDQFGDPITGTYPTYSPAEDWQPGANCSDCSVRPDVTRAFDGTWHDSTYYPGDSPRTVTVTFTGNAVYAFFITPPVLNASLTTATYLNFTLDNELSGRPFNFIPYGSDTYTYNQTVYSKTNLSNSQHTLVMSTGGSQAGLLLFDYVIYTVDTSNTTTSSESSGGSSKTKSPNIGAVVGGVVGGVALLVALALLTFFYRRKTTKRHSEVDPPTREHREEGQFPADLVIPYAVDDSDIQPTTTTYSHSKSSRPSQHPTIFSALSSDPPTSPSNTALSHSTKALAEARQGDINRRMEAVEQQIRTQAPRSGGGEEEDWRTTAQHLRAEIGRLEVALQSQWAQGMSDQPPPEYLERPR